MRRVDFALAASGSGARTVSTIFVVGGNEAATGDRFTVTPSRLTNIVINGMNPVAGSAADQLTVISNGATTSFRTTDSKYGAPQSRMQQTIDGAAVKASSPTDEEVFATSLRQYAVGSKVTLTVHRAGNEIPVDATLRAAPRQAREMKRYEDVDLGFRARELADSDLEDPRLRGTSQGIIVDAIEQGGWAALARLNTGDVILAVDGKPVADVDGLAAQLKALPSGVIDSATVRRLP